MPAKIYFFRRIQMILMAGICMAFIPGTKVWGYRLAEPDAKLLLPAELREISGVTCLNSGIVACVEDEHGIIFLFDTRIQKVIEKISFSDKGDFEGITSVADTMYMLRSDGVVFEKKDFRSSTSKVVQFRTGIPSKDNEAMCYDGTANRLLIASKSLAHGTANAREQRPIYSFDLRTHTLSSEPVFKIDIPELIALMQSRKIPVPMKSTKKGVVPSLKLRISAICKHPVNNKVYVLSAAERLLVVLDEKGSLETVESLRPELFNKAEGISFFRNGDMVVSNEGQTGEASLVKFRYRVIHDPR